VPLRVVTLSRRSDCNDVTLAFGRERKYNRDYSNVHFWYPASYTPGVSETCYSSPGAADGVAITGSSSNCILSRWSRINRARLTVEFFPRDSPSTLNVVFCRRNRLSLAWAVGLKSSPSRLGIPVAPSRLECREHLQRTERPGARSSPYICLRSAPPGQFIDVLWIVGPPRLALSARCTATIAAHQFSGPPRDLVVMTRSFAFHR